MSSEPQEWHFRIRDILEAIERISAYTRGMTAQQFLENFQVVDAVIRNFITIGEATRHIPNEVQTAYPNVPWPDMRAMRNILTHEYDRVDLDIVWGTIQRDLPGLPSLLKQVLNENL